MFKLIKRLLSLLLLVLVLAVALGAVFVYYFDANDYKEQIISYLESQSKRSVELATLNLSLFPSIGFSAGGLKVGENPDFGDTPFLEAEEIQLSLELLPLLRDEVQIDGIVLRGIKVNVLRDARGQFNFADFETMIVAGQDTDKQDAGSKVSQALALTGLGGLTLKEGYLYWDDRLNDSRMEISDLSFESGTWHTNKPTAVSLNAKISTFAGDAKDLTAVIAVNTEVLPDLSTGDATISGTGLTVDVTQLSTPLMARINGKIASLELTGGTLAKNKIPVELDAVINGLSADMPDLDATLNITAEVLPNLANNNMQVYNLSTLANIKGLDKDLRVSATAEQNKTLLAGDFIADNFTVSYDDLKVDGRLELSDLYTNPKAKIAVPMLNYDTWQFRKILLDSSMIDDRILLNLRQAEFHQGRISGQLDSNVKSNLYQLKLLARDVPIDKIQAAVSADGQAVLHGQAQLNLALSGTLGNVDELLASSAGKANVRITQGSLGDKSLAAIVERVVAFLEGRTKRTAGEELIFDDLTATVILNKGIAKNDDLVVQMPLLDMKGTGQVDLIRSQIDYMLYTRLKSRPEIQVPVHISGNLDSPNYKPDFSPLIKQKILEGTELKEKLEEKVTDIEQKIQDKIKGDFLEGLKDKLKLPF
ncbi:MAG: AsmA family protein [Chromatiales bacterium]|nr:AsmA family protein [Chromatiales bacterium]